jgi:hypothetical protein
MKPTVRTILAVAVAVACAAGWAAAQADEDLKAVKKAVGGKPASQRVERIPPAPLPEPAGPRVTAQATPAPETPAPAPSVSASARAERDTPRPSGREPRWFKVRIVERGPKPSRVTVNLPIGLVRSLGDDWPLEVHCRECGRIKLSEVLRSLTTGQDIVDIESEDATVRIWVE